MSYSRIKVWIAAEILTASDLNNEHNGHITNENDLDSRLISEITTRSTLESEHDVFYAAAWNAGSSEIAANRVSKSSMKDDAIGLAEIEAAATDPAAGTGGLRTLGTTSVKACAGNDSRLSDQRVPTNGSVVAAKLGTGAVTENKLGTGAVTHGKVATANKDGAAATPCMRTLGTTNGTACAGNDARLSNTRIPTDGSVTNIKLGTGAVAQAKLKTSTGSVNVSHYKTIGATSLALILPGGEYGFYPRIRGDNNSAHGSTSKAIAKISHVVVAAGNDTGYITRIYLTAENIDNNTTDAYYYTYANQRYVTASGEVHWVFILRDKVTKQNISMWQAPDHPCFGNGGKPLLVFHPFEDYDETKHEIIVINPTNAEIEAMELETIVDDEIKPDKDLLEVIAENYEVDEDSNPAWPSIPVTVGLPKYIIDKKTGKKILVDYRFMDKDSIVEPIKKVIPKPDYIKTKRLRKSKK